MKIVLIGIQGSGKSTQGNILSEKLNVPYLSTGHIFRNLSKGSSDFGRIVKETMNAGYLVPDEETLKIVSEYLKRPEYESGYILDGFPRTRTQAEKFENGIDAVIYINIPDEEAIKRLSFRKDDREDETPPALQKRIELFHKFTEPVIDYYRQHGKLHEINGEGSIDEIRKEISRVLNLE